MYRGESANVATNLFEQVNSCGVALSVGESGEARYINERKGSLHSGYPAGSDDVAHSGDSSLLSCFSVNSVAQSRPTLEDPVTERLVGEHN